jgi:hypothetical protein
MWTPRLAQRKGGMEGEKKGEKEKQEIPDSALSCGLHFPMVATAEETRQLSQIRPYLYIGGFDAASDWQNLKAQGITHVMNVVGRPISP